MTDIDYEKLSNNQLARLAYSLQIDYDPDNFDRDHIVRELDILKQKVLTADPSLWDNEVRSKNIASRVKTPCHEPITLVTNKDTALMSNPQIIFLPDQLKNKDTIYYCLDKKDDVPFILESGINPFTNQPLTIDQINYIQNELQNNKYPTIEVGDYFEEIQKIFKKEAPLSYEEKIWMRRARELSDIISNHGLLYQADQVYNFATDYHLDQYNLFLRHKPIDQHIVDAFDRDNAAAATLNYILNYIKIQKERGIEEYNKAVIQIGHAIDEFVYMVKNNLDYFQLIDERGVVEAGKVKELYWKPNFLIEEYYPGGQIMNRGYINDAGNIHGLMTYYYRNGNIKYEIVYNNGLKNGIFKIFYPDGEVNSETIYKDDIENGISRSWYMNGNRRFESVSKNHEYTIWDDHGVLMGNRFLDAELYPNDNVKEIYFTNGKGIKDGPAEGWYSNTDPEYVGFYRNGLPAGKWKIWNLGVIPSIEGDYESGIWISYHPNGQIKTKGIMINGEKTGIWTVWDENGIFVGNESYKNGQLHGPLLMRYLDGSEEQGIIENGVRIGLWVTTYPDGTVKARGSYDNKNRRVGDWTEWYPNGDTKSSGFYEDGHRMGPWILADEDGTIEYGDFFYQNRVGLWTAKYSNGNRKYRGVYTLSGAPHGLWKRWYENGHLEFMGYYKYGMEHKLWQTWYENGHQKSKGSYYLGEKEGKWVTWYNNGNRKTKEHYHNGQLHGLWTEWYENGNLKSRGFYTEGKKNGLWETWHENGTRNFKGAYQDDIPYGIWTFGGKK